MTRVYKVKLAVILMLACVASVFAVPSYREFASVPTIAVQLKPDPQSFTIDFQPTITLSALLNMFVLSGTIIFCYIHIKSALRRQTMQMDMLLKYLIQTK